MTRTVSQDSPEWAVWTQNAIAFIRSKGLEVEFSDWCGGWPVPVVEGENCKRGGDEPQANAPSIILPDDLISLSEAATQGEWALLPEAFSSRLMILPTDATGDQPAVGSILKREDAVFIKEAVNFIRTLAAKQRAQK